MKLFKIAFLPLLAGILLLPAASRPVRAAGSAAVGAGAGDRKRDKKKKQEADTAAKATPYEKLFKDKRVETVRGGGLTLHLTADKLYLELPDSLLGSAWPTIHAAFNVPISYMGFVSMIISGGTIISGLMSERLTKRYYSQLSPCSDSQRLTDSGRCACGVFPMVLVQELLTRLSTTTLRCTIIPVI